MSVRDWHPGKIGLLWFVYLGLLVAFLGSAASYGGTDILLAFFIWLVLAVPALVITWRWLSGREKNE